jgi:transcription elongation factor/antiterminator RfaH
MECIVSAQRASDANKWERNERWYLVHTHPRSESRAQLHLEVQGFRTHLPRFSKTVRHARKLRTVTAPLFPRYLFISLDLKRDRWLSVQGTYGVSHLFTCEGRPVPVPPKIVEGLIAHGDVAVVAGALHVGQRVRIASGPFGDLIGILERLDDNGRTRVLLQMMGTAVPVAIGHCQLLPAA